MNSHENLCRWRSRWNRDVYLDIDRAYVLYWNWYGFPVVYTASYILIEIVGFVLVGVIAGLMLRRRIPAV